MKLTPEVIYAFSVGMLQHRYDNPKPTPEFHKEMWSYCCSSHPQVAIAAPRGHAKSTAITLAYALAAVLFREREYVIVVSNTESQSIMFLNTIKMELLENDALRSVFYVDKLVKDNEQQLICQMKDGHQFMIAAKSSNGSVRGFKWGHKRPDLIIGDDLEDDEIVMNQDRRLKFKRWFAEAVLPMLSDNGIVRLVGTILHFDSLLESLMPPTEGPLAHYTRHKGLKQYSVNPNRTWLSVKFRAHSDFDSFEEILWPEKFSQAKLETRRAYYIEQGIPEGYAQEYLNYPISEENAYFKRDDFLEMNGNDMEAHGYFYVACDFAISQKEKADYTAMVVGKLTPDNKLHIVDVRRGRWDSKEIIDELFSLQVRYNPDLFIFERGQIEKAIGPFLQEKMYETGVFMSIHVETPVQDKPQRARAIQGRMRAGGVKFMIDASWFPTLHQEMLRFDRAPHDDQVDCMAYLGLVLNKMQPGKTETELEDDEYYDLMQTYHNIDHDGRSKVTGY